MFSTRDQENLVHAQQTIAAGKPLNQSVRALQPKTPGNLKTPFRSSKNDENKPVQFQGQKTVQKDGLGKFDKNTFVTPAAPRNRAPLGAKTTNAKAQPLKTPVQGQKVPQKDEAGKRQSTARRSARSKIVVAPSEPLHLSAPEQQSRDDEPDFGYAPPPVAALPDPPIDLGYDDTFPQFQGDNLFRGYGEIFFASPKDESGMSIRLKREEEEYAEFQKQREAELLKTIQNDRLHDLIDPDQEVEAMIAAGPKFQQAQKPMESKVETYRAKTAAAALANPSARLPSFATKQTASSRAKATNAKPSKEATTSARTMRIRQSPMKVSSNTIGFPKAKKPQSIVPIGQQLRNEHNRSTKKNQREIDPDDFVRMYGEPPIDSDMWYRLQLRERSRKSLGVDTVEIDDLTDELFEADLFGKEEDDDDDDVFQLPMPED